MLKEINQLYSDSVNLLEALVGAHHLRVIKALREHAIFLDKCSKYPDMERGCLL